MSSSRYYFSRKLVKGFGKMRFLINLQEAASSGGGRSLLGSVVKELRSGGFLGIGAEHYPMPAHLSTPGMVLGALGARREALELGDESLTLETELRPSAQTLRVTKKDSYQAGLGSFPSLPVNVRLGIDYERMASVEMSFGPSTRLEYIPTGYLSRLYRTLDGDSGKVDPAVAVDVDENAIVDGILLARELSVAFESTSDFDAEFDANLQQINSLPELGGKVHVARETRRRVVARIADGPFYLVALRTIDWDDLE